MRNDVDTAEAKLEREIWAIEDEYARATHKLDREFLAGQLGWHQFERERARWDLWRAEKLADAKDRLQTKEKPNAKP